MFLGYNTNGFPHHSLEDTLGVLAGLGYQAVGITLDHHALAPGSECLAAQMAWLKSFLDQHGMRSVIETGARFLLDPLRKHEPTLISPTAEDRSRRVAFYRHAIDTAAELGADCVSIWSGTPRDDATEEELLGRLNEGLEETLDHAEKRGVMVGFEPEPGMFIDTTAAFGRMLKRFDHSHLGLTLDIGHLHCMGEPIRESIETWADRLVNVHIEDMCRGDHTHLFFGEGQIAFDAVFASLGAAGYAGGVYVELSRHGHLAPSIARRAKEFLSPLFDAIRS